MEKEPGRGLPAITGQIDHSNALNVFPEALKPYRSTVLALVSSVSSTTVGFPFDTVKTRMQTYSFKSYWHCIAETRRIDGVRGFFRGIWAPLISTSFLRSISVSLYTTAKPLSYALIENTGADCEKYPFLCNIPVAFAAGVFAGAGTSMFSSPFEFTKVYAQIVTLANHKLKPALTLANIRNIVKYQGILGLYSGYKFHIMRDGLGTGVHFALYELFKYIVNDLISGDPNRSSQMLILFAGGVSGVLGWAVVFPLDTLKSVMQRDIVTNILRKETGLPPLPIKNHKLQVSRRIYRGLGVSLARSFLVNMAFFSCYEGSMKYLI